MVQFHGDFIIRQTGDGCEKPETESPESLAKSKKWWYQKMESRKLSLSNVVRESRSM